MSNIHALDGTPADCADIGIYHLFESRPDLLISGINTGGNEGLGFLLSSGTVGACLEANIAGLPAVALSQGLPEIFYEPDGGKRRFDEGVVRHLSLQTERAL